MDEDIKKILDYRDYYGFPIVTERLERWTKYAMLRFAAWMSGRDPNDYRAYGIWMWRITGHKMDLLREARGR